MLVPSFVTVLPRLSPTSSREYKSGLSANSEALVESGLIKLSDHCQELVDELFKDVVQNEQNKLLHGLLPAHNTCTLNLRNTRKFRPVFKTNRFLIALLSLMPSRPNNVIRVSLFSIAFYSTIFLILSYHT